LFVPDINVNPDWRRMLKRGGKPRFASFPVSRAAVPLAHALLTSLHNRADIPAAPETRNLLIDEFN
jgi:hypothetical protein